MKIGIIGAGKMGRWFARLLSKENFEVIISDKDKSRLSALPEDIKAATAGNIRVIEEADIIILAVSIDRFEEVVEEIAPYVRPGQIITDITSIKGFPLELMHRHMSKATILGTHPLFGPGAESLTSQNFILTPTDERENGLARQVTEYLQQHGARVTWMTPQKHDEVMSVVLGLSHFISIVAADTISDLGNLSQFKEVGGSTYRVLTTLMESVVSEDPELYGTLQMRLPNVQEMENIFQMRTAKWAEMVKTQDKAGFMKSMDALKSKFARDNPNFGQAYENMYRIIKWL
jgi:prephenate dehydrogenase